MKDPLSYIPSERKLKKLPEESFCQKSGSESAQSQPEVDLFGEELVENEHSQHDNFEGDAAVSVHDKHKKNKLNGDENSQTSIDLHVDPELPKKHKKKRHLSGNSQQESEECIVELEGVVDAPKKKKRKHIDEEELSSASSTEKSKKKKKNKLNGSIVSQTESEDDTGNKHKKKKENEGEHLQILTDLETYVEASRKHKKKKKKHIERELEENFEAHSEITKKKKHKKKYKDDECEKLNTSNSFTVNTEVSRKHKKRKHVENGQQGNEENFVESEGIVSPVIPYKKKNKKKHDESEIKEELSSPGSTQLFSPCEERNNKRKNCVENGIKDEMFSPSSIEKSPKETTHTKCTGSAVKKLLFSPSEKDCIEETTKNDKTDEQMYESLHSVIDLGIDFPDKIEKHSDKSLDSETNEELLTSPEKKKNKEKRLNGSVSDENLMSSDYSLHGNFNTMNSSRHDKENNESINKPKHKKKEISKKHKETEKKSRKSVEQNTDEDDKEERENVSDSRSSFPELSQGSDSDEFHSGHSPERKKIKKQKKICAEVINDKKFLNPLKIKNLLSVQNCGSDELENEELIEHYLSLQAKIRKMKEKNRLSSTEEEKINGLQVEIPWEIPPLHLIETRVAVRPTEAQRKSIQELGVEVKTGSYSRVEDKQIKTNWEEFCMKHNLPENPKPFMNMVNPAVHLLIPASERIKFVQFLAHDLENRLLCSVYNRFRRLFQDQDIITGRFTREEDKTIIEYMQNSPGRTPYSDLGILLNRNKAAIEKRARKLAEERNIGSSALKWNKKKVEEFLTYFLEVTRVAEVKDLKDRKISTEEWRKMQDEMKIPISKLRNAWTCTIYPQIFVKRRLSTSQVKNCLVRILVERGEDDFKTINWNSVRLELDKEYEGFTAQKLNAMLQAMINYHVPAVKRRNLKACLKYLQEALKNKQIRGKQVRRLKVIDNRDADM